MPLMPAPMVKAPSTRWMRPKDSRLASSSATAEAATAATQDSRVGPLAKPMSIGSRNACMPRKCMDQIPVPMTMEPAAHQARPTRRCDVRTRRARSSVT
ncbi:hypothetical protein D3C80_1826200 [compost metagenome]